MSFEGFILVIICTAVLIILAKVDGIAKKLGARYLHQAEK